MTMHVCAVVSQTWTQHAGVVAKAEDVRLHHGECPSSIFQDQRDGDVAALAFGSELVEHQFDVVSKVNQFVSRSSNQPMSYSLCRVPAEADDLVDVLFQPVLDELETPQLVRSVGLDVLVTGA